MTDPEDALWLRVVEALPAETSRVLERATVVSVRRERETLHVVLRWNNDSERPTGPRLAGLFVDLSEAVRRAVGLELEAWIRPDAGMAINVLHRGSA